MKSSDSPINGTVMSGTGKDVKIVTTVAAVMAGQGKSYNGVTTVAPVMAGQGKGDNGVTLHEDVKSGTIFQMFASDSPKTQAILESSSVTPLNNSLNNATPSLSLGNTAEALGVTSQSLLDEGAKPNKNKNLLIIGGVALLVLLIALFKK